MLIRRVFDRPVFIIAMPRSGSTLLFDLLAKHPRLRSWGDEAYPPWTVLDPGVAGEQGDAVALGAIDGDARARFEGAMHRGVMAHHGTRLGDRRGLRRYRLLDKTPANVLRVGTIDAMFPDALYIHLVRDAPANIASLLEGRDAGLAVRGWPKEHGMDWHFLMPPGWQSHLDDSPAAQFAWQWRVGNETALRDLARVQDRAALVRYEDLIANPEAVTADLVEFAQLKPSDAVAQAARELAPSKHTLSAPRDDKWRDRQAEIAPVLDDLAELRNELGYRY